MNRASGVVLAEKGASMTSASMAMPTTRVEMWFGGTAPQNRLTVFFRIILAIPQFIVLWFLFIAGFFVLVIGWFGALFTGRLPMWARTYLGGVIRWEIRVNAYMFLLTDSYPPFTFLDVEYPVRVILPGSGQLNRLSVFFRIILSVPASVFSQIVVNGLTAPLLFVMWIVVLVTGSMPRSLYDAYSSLLRYLARYHSWFTMLTSEYAWGMLGDFVPPPAAATPPPVDAAGGAAPAAQAPPAQPPSAQPPAQPFSYPSTGAEAATPPAATPPPEGGAPAMPPSYPPAQAPPTGAPGAPGAMPPPSPWERTSMPSGIDPLPPWGTIILQGAARSWMIFAIVWGSIVFIGENILRNSGHHNNTNNAQLNTVPADAGLIHVIETPPRG